MKYKEPTATSLVLGALRAADDFLSVTILVKSTGKTRDQVKSALWWLLKISAVDVVVDERNGTGWWYALPPESDKRSKHYDERTPEKRPRRSARRTKALDPGA